MRADLLEGAGERLDVGVVEVAREVLLDPVPVVPAGALERLAPRVGENDAHRSAVVLGPHAADEIGGLHAIDDAREAALAVQDPLGELVHPQAVGCIFEMDERVVPPERDSGIPLELAVEDVGERENALEIEAPRPQALGRGA